MSEQREKQLLFVYSVVAVVVVYYAITHWIPFLWQAVSLQIAKSQALQSVEGEIQNDDFDVQELANYKSKAAKLKEDAPKKNHSISPNFVLERNQGGPLKAPKAKQTDAEKEAQTKLSRVISPGFQLPVYAPTIPRAAVNAGSAPATLSAAPRANARTGSNTTSSAPEEPTSTPARYLGSFAPGSVEAQLHEVLARRADPFGIQNLQFDPYQLQREAEEEEARRLHKRELREQQDLEYQQALQRDESARLQQEEAQSAKESHEEKVKHRRAELVHLVKPEPEVGEEGCITLQFRSRHTSTLSGANARVKRRFSCTQHTAQDLLHFIESLELRPLLSPASATCVLTLDFPTRVVSCETMPERTLEELGISADSAVWVKFGDE